MPSSRRPRRSNRPSIDAGSKQSVTSSLGDDLSRLGVMCHRAAAAVLPVLLLWSFLVPNDATSVFIGSSVPQTFLAIFVGVLAAGCVALSKAAPRVSAVDTAIALLVLAWVLLVSFLAGGQVNPRTAWLGCWHVIAAGSVYYTARLVLHDCRSRAVILSIIAAGCIAMSIHAVYQTTIDFPASRAEYLADPDGMLDKNGIDAPRGSPTRKRLEDRFLESREPFAAFALANSLAVLLSCGLILIAGCIVMKDDDVDAWRLVIAVAACLLLLVAWFLTKSRTAYLAVFAGMVYWFILTRIAGAPGQLVSRLRWAIMATTVVFAVAFVWFMKNDSLVLSETFYSLRFRLEYWYATAQMIFEHGWTGVGIGNFQDYYPGYKLEQASETIADPHNWLLDIAVSLSVPVAALVCFWIARHVLPGSTGQMRTPERKDANAKPIVWGAVVGGLLLVGGLYLFRQLDTVAFLVSWPAAGIAAWSIYPLCERVARQPHAVLRAGLMTMVVCLLASGSWQANGLLVPFMVLLAGLVESEGKRTTEAQWRWVPVSVASLGLVLFCIQTWLPVTRVWNLRGSLPFARSTSEQLQIIDAAVQADPLDAELLSLRAQILTGAAAQSSRGSFESEARRVTQQLDDWLAVDGVAHVNWMLAGSVLLDLAESAERLGMASERWIGLASEHFTQASQRYPSDVGLHVQVAAVAVLHRDMERAQREIDEAWRLSEATPHDDKRLNMQQIYLPAGLVDSAAATELRSRADGQVDAELAAEWIRNRLNTAQ